MCLGDWSEMASLVTSVAEPRPKDWIGDPTIVRRERDDLRGRSMTIGSKAALPAASRSREHEAR
jgi:hypothetical protein